MKFIHTGISVLSFLLLLSSLTTCVNHEFPPRPFNCTTSNIVIELLSTSGTVGCERYNGIIEVTASGGLPPYQFKIGENPFGNYSFFSGLSAGSFIVTVQDARGCEKQLPNLQLSADDGPTAKVLATHQTNCNEPDGSININVTGGVSPYQYKIGKGEFGSAATFMGLKAGMYTITIQDASSCSIELNETILGSTGVSYLNDIKPILETNCIKSGCHNGDNGGDRNWSIFTNVQNKSAGIRIRTRERSMPPGEGVGLMQGEIDLIDCWVGDGATDN